MNYSLIVYIIGWILNMEAVFMVMPCTVALIYRENEGFAFLLVMLASAICGVLIVLHKPKKNNFYLKEGFVTVALSWITLSIVGALPFVVSGEIPHYVDALFETVSGFTTTGASVLSDVESMSRCCLFWRCFTNWIGGMGVLVFLLIIMPLTGGSYMTLMRAESPGPSAEKLVPKVRHTAGIVYGIYIGLTVVAFLFLLFGGMDWYEAMTTAFGVAGTGGFGIKNDSFMSATPYIQWVVTIFIMLFGVNFGVYYLLLMGKIKSAFKHEEMRVYFGIIIASVVIIMFNISTRFTSFWEALRHVCFQVASIITTTGYASVDYDLWPQNAKTVLLFLMFLGACAGSTGGGFKVQRLIILVKTFGKEIFSYLHPRSVKIIKSQGKMIEPEVVRTTQVYLVAYILVFVMSFFLISFENKDMVTNISAVATTLNNVGPGFELVGPTCNFSMLSNFSKIILMFDMLAGRLELFPILLLFCPSVWKKERTKKFKKK